MQGVISSKRCNRPFSGVSFWWNVWSKSRKSKCSSLYLLIQQAAISQKEIVFRFRKDVQSEKGWGLKCCA